ncbi:MAG: hypothetical protein FWD64_02175 [Acidobacteriaceae bacterium]|nr:hypothetical protein [Acidobacteriaceae bacterium]
MFQLLGAYMFSEYLREHPERSIDPYDEARPGSPHSRFNPNQAIIGAIVSLALILIFIVFA